MLDHDPLVNVLIAFDGEPGPGSSAALEELRSDLAEKDLKGEPRTSSAPGKGDLTVAIQLAGLVLSAVGTAISVLTYWRGRKETPPAVTMIHAEHHVILKGGDDPETVVRELGLPKTGTTADLKVVVKES
jgi:hypothetical protein